MENMKELKTDLLFWLADGWRFLGVAEESEYTSYNQLYWRLNKYRRSSIRAGAIGLIKKGLLGQIKREGRVWLRLTSLGRDGLRQKFWLTRRSQKQWDKKWRVLILDRGKLNLRQQRNLRRQIFPLGFVGLEKGVYICPFGVNNELKKILMDKAFLGNVWLMETRRFVVGDDKSFSWEAFKLNTIYNKYLALSTQAEKVLYRVRREKRLTDQVKEEYGKLVLGWKNVLVDDPGLPKRLLIEDMGRESFVKALGMIAECVRELEKGEQ